MVSRKVLAEAIVKKLTGKEDRLLSQSVAAYLMDEGRTGDLEPLMRDLRQLRADQAGIVEVNVVSAHPLSDTVKADIEASMRVLYPDLKQVIINSKIDESVVGGVRLELANDQQDLTVRAKLNKLKQAVVN